MAQQQQTADALVDEIGAAGGTAVAHEADLGASDMVTRLFDWCGDTLGPVDVLVNNHTHCVPETFDIESYSRSAAAEMGKYGITVNIVASGSVQTGYITPEAEAALAAGTPLGRVGRPQDVSDVIVFLASEQAHWLTGQFLYVGGGWRMGQ